MTVYRFLSGLLALSLWAASDFGVALADENPAAVAASAFVGAPVTNLDGEDLGEVSELVFDVPQAFVAYVVVTLDGGGRYALPWSALQWAHDGERRALTVWNGKQVARAAELAGDAEGAVDLTWAARGFARLGYDPYWAWWHCTGGWGPATQDALAYNSDRLVVVEGEVARVERYTPSGATSPGVRLFIERGALPDLPVHLGPAWYLEQRDIAFAAGDRLEIHGTEYLRDGAPTLAAGRIVRGGDRIALRHPDGVAAWSGWTPDGPPIDLRPLSELMGAEVKTATADPVGEITEVMLDPASGISPYAVLSHLGERRVLPLAAVAPQRNVQTLLLVAEADALRNPPALPADGELTDPVWLDGLYSHYGLPAGMAAYPRPWRMPDEYTRLYGAADVITLGGAVLGIYPVPLAGDRTGLIVRIHVGGELPHAYLGPVDNLELAGIRLGISDYIEVTGGRAIVDGRLTVIADSVRFRGVLLKLRNELGQPLWCERGDAVILPVD